MKKIFPITVNELSSGDTYSFHDLRDLKIFLEEFKDILADFEATTAEGHHVKLRKDILFADSLISFIEYKENK